MTTVHGPSRAHPPSISRRRRGEVQHELEVIRQYIPPERKQQPRKFADVVSDINRKALKSLEQVLEKRRSVDGEGTKELEERIAKLRESLEAVNYVDVIHLPTSTIRPRTTRMNSTTRTKIQLYHFLHPRLRFSRRCWILTTPTLPRKT